MQIRVKGVDFWITDCRTRLPFRFGMVTLTELPLCLARVTIENEQGVRQTGYAGDLLVPKWFEKDPAKSPRQDSINLAQSALAAARAYQARGQSTVFSLWRQVYQQRVGELDKSRSDLLVRGFGVAMLERAIMDATCRAAQVTFFDALKQDLFGFEPAQIRPELAGWRLADDLPDRPAESIQLRHTVGMADILSQSDLPEAAQLNDHLPQTLDQDIGQYGVNSFKVKIGAGHDADVKRLLALASFLEENLTGQYAFTLDGNEQFQTIADVLAVLAEVQRDPTGSRLLSKLLYIEQPLARHATFDPTRHDAMPALRTIAPVIIDEADASVNAFTDAIKLGYQGVSVKACKGVFRALINYGVCRTRGCGLFQSAEDLTNLAVVSLQQDLALSSALHLPHVERNGHHYFHGLSHLPQYETESALHAHPDLYTQGQVGVHLDIQQGRLSLDSLTCIGFGYDCPIQVESRTPLSQWMK